MVTTAIDADTDEISVRVTDEFLRVMGDGPQVAGFLQAVFFETDTRELARRIKVPTLVIHGQKDQTVPIALGRDLAALIPGARFEILMGADHREATFSSPELKKLCAEFLAPLSSN